jgi:type IV pilus assembly protein PilC
MIEKIRTFIANARDTGTPKGDSSTPGGIVSNSKIRLSRKEKIFFLDSFGSLVNAGIPVVKSLQTIYFQSKNPRLRALSLFLKCEIEMGANMAKTAAKLGDIFSAFDVAMFEMGDATGQLGKVLETVTEREEKSLELGSKVKAALIYPLAIAVIAAAMIAVIMTYVVPKIEAVYRESNAALPGLTVAVIGSSRFLREYGILVLGIVILGVFAIPLLRKNPAFRMASDGMFLKIPIFGEIIRKKILITYAEFLSSLLLGGIVINRALLIVRSGMGNAVYEREIDALIEEVKTGKPLSAAMG